LCVATAELELALLELELATALELSELAGVELSAGAAGVVVLVSRLAMYVSELVLLLLMPLAALASAPSAWAAVATAPPKDKAAIRAAA